MNDQAGRIAGKGGAAGAEPRARLISAAASVRERLGEAVWSELTYAKIFRDSVENTTPVIVERGGAATVAINISDSCALDAAERALPVATWGHYFDWNQAPGAPVRSFAEVVRDLAGPGTIVVDPELPFVRHAALAATGPVEIEGRAEAPAPVFIHRKARAEVEAQWDATRRADAEAVAGFVTGLRRGADLIAAMQAPAIGYAPLDELMRAGGLGAFLVTSPFTGELFTGLPEAVAAQHGIACLFLPGEDDVVVLSRQPLRRGDFRPEGQAPDLAQAVAKLARGGVVGFEGGHLPIGVHAGLKVGGCELREAIGLLRRWQDIRAGTDLPYFIVAANAVLRGFDHAAAFIGRRIGEGLSEREAGAAFDQGAARFAASVGFADRIGPSFDIIHSGERTLLPASAGDHPLLAAHRTIKFDMGILVRDAHGCVRACSDIARTWSPDAAVARAHDELRAALVDRLIPAMRPGLSGGQIHALGVEALRGAEAALAAAGLMPEGRGMEGYVRDCGHTIHRTTAGSVYFLPGAAGTVEAGMLGCVEYVWPIGDRIVAVEDGYFVTETEVIPFTA